MLRREMCSGFRNRDYKVLENVFSWLVFVEPILKYFEMTFFALVENGISRKFAPVCGLETENAAIERISGESCGNNQHQNNNFLHSVLLVVLLLNIYTFAASSSSAFKKCSEADCHLYTSQEYLGCSGSTNLNPQYSCQTSDPDKGVCGTVCGGCGYYPKLSGWFRNNKDDLDAECRKKTNCQEAYAVDAAPLLTSVEGSCGVWYQTFSGIIAPLCYSPCGLNSSEAPSSSSSSSSSSAEPSSSSSYRVYMECNNSSRDVVLCYNSKGNCPGCAVCSEWWVQDQLNSSCYGQGYCGYTTSAPSAGECQLRRAYDTSPPTQTQYINCIPCFSSSSSEMISSIPDLSSSSADEGSSGSGDGGDSGAGGSSGSGEGGSGDGSGIPCGYDPYPPCEVLQVNNPPGFCTLYPELCSDLGSLTDSLSALIDAVEGIEGGSGGSCLDSANCQPAAWSGDSIGYVPGDSASGAGSGSGPGSGSGGGSGSGSGSAYSWLSAVLGAAQIPTASRICPDFPPLEFEFGGEEKTLDIGLCRQSWNIGGVHVLQLLGLILRAVASLYAVYIVLGSVTSLNAGFSKMKRLGR